MGQRDTEFIDGIYFNNLKQLSGISNTQGRQLDLIFGNSAVALDRCPVLRAPLPLVDEDSYHPAIEMTIPITPDPLVRPSLTSVSRELNFRKLDRVKFDRLINENDWSFLVSCPTIDVAVTKFTSVTT
uniref:Endonuclease/exonuclease/phosphatase domain-containing protein n=1 Tax=Anopheles maculatus TaxID=74869 RepID=A0A182SNF9_9DIPT